MQCFHRFPWFDPHGTDSVRCVGGDRVMVAGVGVGGLFKKKTPICKYEMMRLHPGYDQEGPGNISFISM